jgi:simple sugar transport system permease protein
MGMPDATVLVLQGLMFVVLLVSETLYGRIPFFRQKGT